MSTNKIIAELDAEQMGREVPDFAPGDTVVVQVRVKEGNRERLQAFEGVCIAKRNRGLNSAFTVRKVDLQSKPTWMNPHQIVISASPENKTELGGPDENLPLPLWH